MTCPRCGDEPMLGAIVPGGPRVFCVNGPFGWPCGEQILPTPHVKHEPKERDIQRAVIRYLELQPNVLVLRQSVGLAEHEGRRVLHGVPGQADLTVAIGPDPAIVEFWEIKRPKEKQRPMQVRFEERCRRIGAAYRLIHSIEEARKALVEAKTRRSA